MHHPDVVIIMTDEERNAPPYEGDDLKAWREEALPARHWFQQNGVSFERHYTGSLACVPSPRRIFPRSRRLRRYVTLLLREQVSWSQRVSIFQ